MAITSRPWSLTVEAANADRDFLMEIIFDATNMGAKSTRPGRVKTDMMESLPSL